MKKDIDIFFIIPIFIVIISCKKKEITFNHEPIGICKIQYLSNGSLIDTFYYDDQFRIKRFAQPNVKLDYYYTDNKLKIIRTYPGVTNSMIDITYDNEGRVKSILFQENSTFRNITYKYENDLVIRSIQQQSESNPYIDTLTYIWKNGNISEKIGRYGSCTPSYDYNHDWQEADLLNLMFLYEYGVPSPIKTKNLITQYCNIAATYLFDSTDRISARIINLDTTRFWYICR